MEVKRYWITELYDTAYDTIYTDINSICKYKL